MLGYSDASQMRTRAEQLDYKAFHNILKLPAYITIKMPAPATPAATISPLTGALFSDQFMIP
jgi:hypothetical protein